MRHDASMMTPFAATAAVLLGLTLTSCGGGQDGEEPAEAASTPANSSPARPSPSASATPSVDPADQAACEAFAAAMSLTLDLIQKAREGEELAPIIVAAIAGAAETRANEAAAAASPDAAAAMKRAAANAGLIEAKADAAQGGPLDIATEAESTISSIRTVLTYCSAS